jgi:hypothetical protein
VRKTKPGPVAADITPKVASRGGFENLLDENLPMLAA